ncbi:MAG TPA: M28 family peptidase [Blastocatellia bacterium]|nr:M28 family peptidase [Blastocatellia bacterium]
MLLLIATITMLGLLGALWLWLTQPLLVRGQSVSPSAEVSAKTLRFYVEMLTDHLSPRDYTHPENLDLAAAWLREKFTAFHGRAQMQKYDVSGRTYRNVTALFGPETKERVIIGAHYDTCQPYPGADDNASGVAGLLALAELLGRTELSRQVELVAYTLEEPPFFRSEYMGSAIHARALREQGIEVRAMLSLEMIGYFSDAPDSQEFPNRVLRLFYPSQGNFIAVVGNFGQAKLVRQVKRAMRETGAIPVYSINAPGRVPGVDFSDHLNYQEQGWPAVMITDTAFYRNKNYHTAQDTPDQLDYQRMAMVVKSVYAAVLKIAQAD